MNTFGSPVTDPSRMDRQDNILKVTSGHRSALTYNRHFPNGTPNVQRSFPKAPPSARTFMHTEFIKGPNSSRTCGRYMKTTTWKTRW